MPVRLLPDTVIDQIAAGEVVERPAAVVKELVENSLDAGARSLRVDLRAGGNDLIRVSDDGHGMDRQDAIMCLERHATSKIRSLDDLVHVRSFGFRGEAVPSIASVSRFELITRRAEDEVGTRVEVEGGEVRSVRDAGCPVGTDIKVRDLFFNIPVRRGFLRTAATELGHCTEAVVRQALLHPEVDVRVVHNGREHLRLAAVEDRAERARAVLTAAEGRLRPVAFSSHGVQVEGLISPPSVHHASGRGVYLFVNGRYVRDPVVRRGVREAYQGLLPSGRHPTLVVALTVADEHVDVNVHPSKIEVRFRNPRDVAEAVASGLREALRRPQPHRRGAEHGFDARPRKAPTPSAPTLPGLSAHPADDPDFTERAPPPLPTWLAEMAEPGAPLAGDRAPGAVTAESGSASTVDAGSAPEVGSEGESSSEASTQEHASEGGVTPRSDPSSRGSGGFASARAEPSRALPPATLGALSLTALLDERLAIAVGEGWVVLVDLAAVQVALVERTLDQGGAPERLLMPVVAQLGRGAAARLVAWSEPLDDLGLSLASFSPAEIAVKRAPEPLVSCDWSAVLPALANALPATAHGPVPAAARAVLNRAAVHAVTRFSAAEAMLAAADDLAVGPPIARVLTADALRELMA